MCAAPLLASWQAGFSSQRVAAHAVAKPDAVEYNAQYCTSGALRLSASRGSIVVLYSTARAAGSLLSAPIAPPALASSHRSVACGYESVQRAANAGALRRAEVPILQASTVLSAYQSTALGLALVRVITMSQRAARSPVAWSALAGALQ